MTNFEHIKNMDIETFAMFLTMDRKGTVNDIFELLKVEYKATSDFTAKVFKEIKEYLSAERDTNV